MKNSAELLGLSLFSIEEGKEVGAVMDLVINPDKGTVEYLVVNNGVRYLGLKILPFKNVIGVGEHAITISNTSSILDFKDIIDLNDLLTKDVQIKGTKVITQKGKIIGTVNEYLVDDENDGKITGCILSPVDETIKTGLIPAEKVVTFGKDILVVEHGIEENIVEHSHNNSQMVDAPKEIAVTYEQITKDLKEEIKKEAAPAGKEEVTGEPTKLFEDRQRQYLVGKKANKTITSEEGNILVEEGTVLTQEMVEVATKAGKLLDLIMNTR